MDTTLTWCSFTGDAAILLVVVLQISVSGTKTRTLVDNSHQGIKSTNLQILQLCYRQCHTTGKDANTHMKPALHSYREMSIHNYT